MPSRRLDEGLVQIVGRLIKKPGTTDLNGTQAGGVAGGLGAPPALMRLTFRDSDHPAHIREGHADEPAGS